MDSKIVLSKLSIMFSIMNIACDVKSVDDLSFSKRNCSLRAKSVVVDGPTSSNAQQRVWSFSNRPFMEKMHAAILGRSDWSIEDKDGLVAKLTEFTEKKDWLNKETESHFCFVAWLLVNNPCSGKDEMLLLLKEISEEEAKSKKLRETMNTVSTALRDMFGNDKALKR